MNAANGEPVSLAPLPPPMRGRVAGPAPDLLSSARASDPVYRILGSAGELFGAAAFLDKLCETDGALERAAAASGGRLLVRPPVTEADELPWLPTARRRFEDACDQVSAACAQMEPPTVPVLWPHAACAVSDAPSIATFLRGREAWGFILDPVALLTPSMLERAEDHLGRLFEALGPHARAHAVVLGIPRVVGDRVAASSPRETDGHLWKLILDLCERTCPPGLPILLAT